MSPATEQQPEYQRNVWRDEYSGFRLCRERLQARYGAFTTPNVAKALGRDHTWLWRIESGAAGPTIPNFALLASAYLGLLRETFPDETHTLHTFLRDIPYPRGADPRQIPTCDGPFCWHTAHLRQELGQILQPDSGKPAAIPRITAGAQLHNEVIETIEAGTSAGSIHALRNLYHYFRAHLNRPLLLDEILTIPARIPPPLAQLRYASPPSRRGRPPR